MTAPTKTACLIRMPIELKSRLAERAVVEHRSFNKQVVKLLVDALDDDVERAAVALQEALRR